jgi:hypothetical protein
MELDKDFKVQGLDNATHRYAAYSASAQPRSTDSPFSVNDATPSRRSLPPQCATPRLPRSPPPRSHLASDSTAPSTLHPSVPAAPPYPRRSLPNPHQHRLSSRPGAWPLSAATSPHAASRLTARRNPQYRPASPTHHAADPIPAPVQECRGLLSPRALKPASTTRDAPSTSAPARHPPHACGEPILLSSSGITACASAAASERSEASAGSAGWAAFFLLLTTRHSTRVSQGL